jgi:phospholipase C
MAFGIFCSANKYLGTGTPVKRKAFIFIIQENHTFDNDFETYSV